ncbi:MAG: hypothetical protein ABUS49_08125, partial [Acidobacteriota bacterium]
MEAALPDQTAVLALPHAGPPALCSAWGLSIASELPLPEFTPLHDRHARADVEIVFGTGERWIDDVRDMPSSWTVGLHEAR